MKYDIKKFTINNSGRVSPPPAGIQALERKRGDGKSLKGSPKKNK